MQLAARPAVCRMKLNQTKEEEEEEGEASSTMIT